MHICLSQVQIKQDDVTMNKWAIVTACLFASNKASIKQDDVTSNKLTMVILERQREQLRLPNIACQGQSACCNLYLRPIIGLLNCRKTRGSHASSDMCNDKPTLWIIISESRELSQKEFILTAYYKVTAIAEKLLGQVYIGYV